ncbi:hypothetical protein AAEU42_00450 [Pseudoflavonifractor phocaeensis]|uniref:hypothetical protein n=1 Tax=Pseudoflavonifractor phocaeensis TaxID=1870988 RepID=UPI00313E1EA3
MKKRLAALLCAVVLLCAAALPRAEAAASTVYLLATNDKMCDLPGGLLPVAVSGTIYVPYLVFDKATTGVDLGVYYGLTQERGTILTLYSLSGYLTFTVNMGICVDNQDTQMDFRAVIRNGVVYVPAAAVCNFFGLTYSFLPTTDRGTLIRITNSSSTLSDSVFLSSASGGMNHRYNNIINGQEPMATPAVNNPAPTAPPQPSSTPAPGSTTKEDVHVYLAVDASQAGEGLLSLFPSSTHALFLFTPDSLAPQSALIRQAVAAGHSVGLIVDGSAEDALEQLERGNELLTHIARIRTRIVSAPERLTASLTGAGWSCWTPNVTGSTSADLLRGLESRKSMGRVTLPANTSVVSRVLSQLRADRYTLRQPLETNL